MNQNLMLIDLSYLGMDRMSTRKRMLAPAAASSYLVVTMKTASLGLLEVLVVRVNRVVSRRAFRQRPPAARLFWFSSA